MYLQFAPNGQYGADDPVNYHFGTYRPTGDGFATSHVAITLSGYAGNDPVTLLAMAAIPPWTPYAPPRLNRAQPRSRRGTGTRSRASGRRAGRFPAVRDD